MSAIFEKASVWNPYDVVRIEQRTPRRYDRKGRPLALDSMVAEDGFGEKDNASGEKNGTTAAHETRDASSTGSH